MSDEALGGETPIEDPTPPAEPVVEATAETGTQPDPTPDETPAYDYLDVEDPSSKYVKVKVDGEELDVPLSEALSGYQRHADYTRGKQALAEERKQAEEALQVYQAMQANPGLTVQVLAQRAGVSVQEYLGMSPQERQDATQEQAPEFDDPLERELYETRQQVAEMQRQMQDRAADERLARVTNGLREQYSATDDEIREAVRQTAQMNLGIDAVPMVFRAMAYDKTRTQQEVAAETAAQRQQAEQQRQAAASAAQEVVASGSRSANGVTQAAPSHHPKSTREAIEMAFQELESARRR